MSEYTAELEGPGALRTVRDALRAWLGTTPCREGCPDDVELVVSELATNALTHGNSPARLRAVIDDGHVHIEVGDDHAQPPQIHAPQGSAGGFGLQIVHNLALDWGWRRTDAGKVVWADIAL